MSANRMDSARADAGAAEKPGDPPAAAKALASRGLQAWLPLLVALVVMPLVAYAVTAFLLVPKLQRSLGQAPAIAEAAAESEAEPAAHGSGHGAPGAPAKALPGAREQVVFTKLLVNVAGSMGSRLLLTSLTLVSTSGDFKGRVARNEAQLRDTACGILSTKTIADLEKPGARNIIRSELLTAFNNVFGGTVVQEIYFTEFAIQ
jgi:flagellar FliL protein